MSKSHRQRWRIVIESYTCPTCGAGASRRCETYAGKVKTEPHADRARLAEARGWRAADELDPDDPQHDPWADQ